MTAQSNSAASSNSDDVKHRVVSCRRCRNEYKEHLFRGKWVDYGCGQCILRAEMIEIGEGGVRFRQAIERLSACVEAHRAGEAMSGYQAAHVEVPVAALETVLKALGK